MGESRACVPNPFATRQPGLCAAQVDTTLSELVRDLGMRTDAIAESDLRLPMKTKMDMYGAASHTVFMMGFGSDPLSLSETETESLVPDSVGIGLR